MYCICGITHTHQRHQKLIKNNENKIRGKNCARSTKVQYSTQTHQHPSDNSIVQSSKKKADKPMKKKKIPREAHLLIWEKHKLPVYYATQSVFVCILLKLCHVNIYNVWLGIVKWMRFIKSTKKLDSNGKKE